MSTSRGHETPMICQLKHHGGVAIVVGLGIRLTPVTVAVDAPFPVAYTIDGSFAATIVVEFRLGLRGRSSRRSSMTSPPCWRSVYSPSRIVLMVGDINIPLDRTDDPDTVRFLDMIAIYAFQLQLTPANNVVITQLEFVPIPVQFPSTTSDYPITICCHGRYVQRARRYHLKELFDARGAYHLIPKPYVPLSEHLLFVIQSNGLLMWTTLLS